MDRRDGDPPVFLAGFELLGVQAGGVLEEPGEGGGVGVLFVVGLRGAAQRALGQPTAVQRKLEFALAPGLEWTIQCYLDLETLQPDGGSLRSAVVDYKIKGSPLSQQKADHDPQAGLYLAARWLEGAPARGFSFAQIARPGKQRKQMSASCITTHRTTGQLRGSLARIALAASQIVTYYQRFGPDQPWGFADPSGWKCSPRYCSHWRACPGGRGL